MQEPVGSFDGLDGSTLAAVLDGLPEPVALWGSDQRCLFANEAAAAALGWSTEELRGAPLVDVLGTHALRLVRSRFFNALEGVGSEQERAMFDGEGALRHYRTICVPVRIDEVVIGVGVVLVDVTEALNAQSEVARDRLRAARLTERHRLTVAAGSEVSGRLRRTLEQLQAPRPAGEPEADLHRLAEELRSCTRRLREGTRGSPAAPEHGMDSAAVSTTAPSTVSTSPSSVDGQDADARSLSLWSSQASPQPSVVHRAAGLEAEVFALLDQLPVVVTVWDRTPSLRYANRAANAVLARWGIAKAKGRRLEQIVSEDFLRAHEAYAAEVLRGRAQAFRRRQISPDGQEHHFHVRYVPRIDDGEVIGAFAYACDLTDALKVGDELIAARSAYAALHERQAIEDRLHASVLQELFAAAMLLDNAARDGDDKLARLEESKRYLQMALDGLAQLS